MFTLEEINKAHAKVRSGADFPRYVQEIREFGVETYTTFVSDGHTDYYDANSIKLSSPPKYGRLGVAEKSSPEEFIKGLREHQEGRTDYPTFCTMCAENGIERWTVSLNNLTCTYYDRSGEEILTEKIPDNM